MPRYVRGILDYKGDVRVSTWFVAFCTDVILIIFRSQNE